MTTLPIWEYWKCARCGTLNVDRDVNCKNCGKHRDHMNGD